jgi:ATP-binding cassette subfamily C (CFTR/MRP) protein 4
MGKKIDPEENIIIPTARRQDSNFFMKWTFTYFDELARRGNKKELTSEDFPIIEDHDSCSKIATAINKEFKLAKKQKRGLWFVLYKLYGVAYLVAGVFLLIFSMLQLAQGYYLGSLLRWFEGGTDSNQGYYYAIVLSVLSFVTGMSVHVALFIPIRLGMQVRVGLIAAIYQKCLSLSLANTESTGFIVNLVSNDVQRFEDVAIFGNYLWIGPVQMVVAMFLIYLEIGWVFLAPMAGLLFLVPLQSSFGKWFGAYRKQAVVHRDTKIKTISDMLSGIMIVKLYAWEKPFIKAIDLMRNLEMDWIWKGNRLKAINESIFFTSAGIFKITSFYQPDHFHDLLLYWWCSPAFKSVFCFHICQFLEKFNVK